MQWSNFNGKNLKTSCIISNCMQLGSIRFGKHANCIIFCDITMQFTTKTAHVHSIGLLLGYYLYY